MKIPSKPSQIPGADALNKVSNAAKKATGQAGGGKSKPAQTPAETAAKFTISSNSKLTGLINGKGANSLAHEVLLETSQTSSAELSDVKDRIEANNEKRAALRELKNAVQSGDASGLEKLREFIGKADLSGDENLGPVTDKLKSMDARGMLSDWKVEDSKPDWQELKQEIETASESMNDMSQQLTHELQIAFTRAQEAASNVHMKVSDSQSAVIENI